MRFLQLNVLINQRFQLQAKRYRRDIQALRGLSVLAVVLFHTSERLFSLGYLGVDIFFVISGFVITPLILQIIAANKKLGESTFKRLVVFYKRRFWRLAPALSVVLTLSGLMIFALGPIDDHDKFSKQGLATLVLAGNLGAYRFSGDYFSPNPNPLVHTWSLSVEEQIYLLLPIILIVFCRKSHTFLRVSLKAYLAITVLSITSFFFEDLLNPIYSLLGIQLTSGFSFYSPVDRIWQFTLGGVGFLIMQSEKRRLTKIMKLSSCIITLFLLFGHLDIPTKTGSTLISFAALFLINSHALEALPTKIANLLTWLGDRSYSIYLVHMPLLYLAKYSNESTFEFLNSEIIRIIIALILTIALGSLSYAKVEERFRLNTNTTSTLASNSKAFKIAIFLSPLTVLALIQIGSSNHYWGLERNIVQPAYAADLDPSCDRDSESGPPCKYITSGSSRTVLLIGDSHAGHLSQALLVAAQKQNWNTIIWTHSGCYVQFRVTSNDEFSNRCLALGNNLKQIIKTENPDLIVISQFIHANSNQIELRNTLKVLKSLTPNVLLVENSPVFPDEENFMTRRPIIMGPYDPPKLIPKKEMNLTDTYSSNALSRWAQMNQIQTLNLESLYCDELACVRYKNGQWLYRDTNHLSVAGADLAIPLFEKVLGRI